jgi:hypothetical protein
MDDAELAKLLAANRFPIGDPLGDSRFRCHAHLAVEPNR